MNNDIVFYTPENVAILWGYVRDLLSFVSPGVMITVAIIAVGLLLTIIINSFKKAAKEEDDEYEVRRY